ncbi:MAG: type I DNA topoisomerase [Candidatus Bipolaricaulis sp.]|nr:type I DNA topoisomerase [Candidatus Bipolaricaulis sp.]MDD5647015.1 type I DNA topoisomerase [Candidatus Bipolaricaulis sp.]
MKKLIIVESPTKARTIGQYLGKEYRVLSSQGHVRDLPQNDLGVDIEKGFEPKFETKRTKLLTELRKAAEGVDKVYLATDHDREGEAIAYDLFTILNRVVKNEKAFSRPIFNEITKPVIQAALAKPEAIDLDKVEAQRTRRILDRLMGYMVSPLLSRILAGSRFAGLSAGRVQSVALRFLCDREREIAEFVPEEYWEIDAELGNGEPFHASVTHRGDEKLFVRSQAEADAVETALKKAKAVVTSVEEKDRLRNPAAPFITSSLQQAASSFLGFSPKRTMSVAQELYEGISLPEGNEGLITYMRTDSVRLSDEAVAAAREEIEKTYGAKYLAPEARGFKNKRRSQDAHEAIRPTDVGRSPDAMAPYLTADQHKLYRLIYGRFLATQMTPSVFRQRTVTVTAGEFTLQATGSRLEFDGFLRVLPDRRDKEAQFPPDIRKGKALALLSVAKRQKFTEPPRRYSEAGLVNLLEKEGIGRPSTYASIVSVIQERGYAVKDGGSLRPTLLGQMVVDFLNRFFAETIEPHFTAHLEEDLDRIEEGEMSRVDALNEFYGPFAIRLGALEKQLEDGEERPFQVPSDVACDVCGAPMELRYWKGTHFLGCSRYPECKNTVNVPPNLDVVYAANAVRAKEALEKAAATTAETIECPKCGGKMELRTGRYGRYFRCTNADCGETAPVSTGVACPVCGEGTLVEKYAAKRRRTFYSCNRYPKCRFAVSDRPVRACPSCGTGLLVEKQGELRCTSKECGYREEPGDGFSAPLGD